MHVSDGRHGVSTVTFPRAEWTHEEYNSLVDEFYQQVVKPHEGIGVEVLPPVMALDIRANLDDAAYAMFRQLSSKKLEAASHPAERGRWHNFAAYCFLKEVKLSVSELCEALEKDGWPTDTARELASQFEDYLELLEAYESIRSS